MMTLVVVSKSKLSSMLCVGAGRCRIGRSHFVAGWRKTFLGFVLFVSCCCEFVFVNILLVGVGSVVYSCYLAFYVSLFDCFAVHMIAWK